MRYKMPYSLFKRGDYWYYRTYDLRGKRTTAHSTGCTNKTKAMMFCEELIKYNRLTGERKIKFSEYAENFFDDDSLYVLDRGEPLTQRTLDNYRNATRKLIPLLENLYMTDITYITLKQLRVDMLCLYAAGTVKITMNVLNLIMTQAYREQIIHQNPFELLGNYKWQVRKRDAFTLDEVKILYQKIYKRYKNLVLLLALTGMRISEALGVRKEDIKTNDKGIEYIDLKSQLVRGSREQLKTKNNRAIPIIPEIKDLLYEEELTHGQITKAFKVVIRDFERSDDKRLAIHSLRHFFITNAKSCGVNPLKVEKIAGHSLKGMEGTYTNFNVDDLKEILEWQKKTLSAIV